MTEPADYVTEGEIVKRMRVGMNSGRKALQLMRKHPNFPPKTIGGKRFWPSVVDFLQFWNGRTVEGTGNPAGQELNNGQTESRTVHARPKLAAAEEWLGRCLDRQNGLRQEGIQAGHAPDRNLYK
jgi:hypothetical protein